MSLTSRYTSKILNAIKPVARAFTVMDIVILIGLRGPIRSQRLAKWLETMNWNQPINENRLTPTHLGMWMLKLKEVPQHGYCFPTQSSNGRSLKWFAWITSKTMFMRTRIAWEMKSQSPFNVISTKSKRSCKPIAPSCATEGVKKLLW